MLVYKYTCILLCCTYGKTNNVNRLFWKSCKAPGPAEAGSHSKVFQVSLLHISRDLHAYACISQHTAQYLALTHAGSERR